MSQEFRAATMVRRLFFLVGDVALIALSLLAAAWLRFDGRIPPELLRQLPAITALSVGIKVLVFSLHRMYALSWPQVGLDDMVRVFRGVTLGSAAFWITALLLRGIGFLPGFPRAVLLLDYVLTLYAIGAFRMGRRIYQYLIHSNPVGGRRAVIVGAGAAGEQLARSLRQTPESGYTPVGFVDDDPLKAGAVIHGLRVLGGREGISSVIGDHQVEAVLIAMPSAPSRVIRQIVSSARDAGVREIRIVPGLDRLLNGRLSFTDLRDVQLTDLLGREVVKIDTVDVGAWLRSRVVLVTGAGGSIGSELCRQISPFHPKGLILLDRDESDLFWMEQELKRLEQPGTAVLADVRDAGRMRDVLARYRPHVVFHVAAYKHVGLMERHLEDAVDTNILGTLATARASVEAGVEKFILISTDKAVNPTSVMGVTKRIAEQVCLALGDHDATRFLAVRFGNVLGSRGSVIPFFQDKIRRGDPIVVRGANMRRYFMATSEAVLLVLQAALMGQGGEVFVLDMGEPVRIIDLAKELIRLSGLQPDTDVPIVFGDPEPGEKEHEDLLSAEEGTAATRHDRIFIARDTSVAAGNDVIAQVARLEPLIKTHDVEGLVAVFQQLVPTYQPSTFLLSHKTLSHRGPQE
jgi:FlaA1/EpsC-like NDP-sugar epimerase